MVDCGYHVGSGELRAWLGEADARLGHVLLTHCHSDHAGGVAALEEQQPRVWASVASRALVAEWDERGLWLGHSGQELPRFEVHESLTPGQILRLGPWCIEVLATPGHMSSALSFYLPELNLVITGDALWERGFGLLDPWVEGEGCFQGAATALAVLARLPSDTLVIPGHGPPFLGLHHAVGIAEQRLERLRHDRREVRRQILASGLGFLKMARPELGAAALAGAEARLLEQHPL